MLKGVIIASVVPHATKIILKNLKTVLPHIKPLVLGKNINVPVKNKYSIPSQVGQDRLVDAYAAIRLYGAPAIVVDFGTAITFNVISKNKEYLGGIILPGLATSLNALAEKTALLPKISLEKPAKLIGRNTKQSILSGIIFGFSSLADVLTAKIKHQIGRSAKVIATGGHSTIMKSYCSGFNAIDKDLTLKGLMMIYEHTISG
jgi:type III pantothenate kinase